MLAPKPSLLVKTHTRIAEIDLLRFLAAMAVVLFHYAFRGYAADDLSVMDYPALAPVAKYGFLGVHLFFMISGFVILMTAANGSLKVFVASRVARLCPAFWACCTITFLTILAIGGDRFSASWLQYVVNMITLGRDSFGLKPIDGVYWSLQVELRFYVLVAIVLIVGKIHRAQSLLWLWLASATLVEVFPFIKLHGFLVVDYAGYFIAGAAFFLVWASGFSLERGALLVAAWGLTIFEALKALPDMEDHYGASLNRWVVAAIVTVFFVLMLLIALRRTGVWGRLNWLWLGAVTYPLYLVHENLGFMIFNIGYPSINQHVLFWGTVLFSIGIAYVVHAGIERRYAPCVRNALSNFFHSSTAGGTELKKGGDQVI